MAGSDDHGPAVDDSLTDGAPRTSNYKRSKETFGAEMDDDNVHKREAVNHDDVSRDDFGFREDQLQEFDQDEVPGETDKDDVIGDGQAKLDLVDLLGFKTWNELWTCGLVGGVILIFVCLGIQTTVMIVLSRKMKKNQLEMQMLVRAENMRCVHSLMEMREDMKKSRNENFYDVPF